VALAGLALAATGCIKIDSTLDLNANGSGKWHLIYSMPPHMVKQVQNANVLTADLRRAGGDTNAMPEPLDIPLLFDEVTLRNRFVPLAAQGITLERLEVKPRGGWTAVDMKVQFTSLEKLLNLPFFADCGATFRRDPDGTGRLALVAPQLGLEEKVPDLTPPDVSMSVSPFLRGMLVAVRIGLPGDIRNTNAGQSNGRRATWEWDYERDPLALNRLNKTKMIVIFDGAGTGMAPFEKVPRAPVQ
jgi:hypothetical protein